MSANGQLADSELTTVDGWARLTPSTAAAYLAAAAYVLLHFRIGFVITSPDGAYRSLARQVIVKAEFGIGAATPGYSNHGLGTAFDMFDITAVCAAVGGQAALDAIMARFGFVRDAGNGAGGIESWHYHLVAVVDLAGLTGATQLHITTTPTLKEAMYIIRSSAQQCDIIVRADGHMTVILAASNAATNQLSAMLSIPIAANDEFLNSTLTLIGAPDFGTMKAAPGTWFAPIGR
jgi:hypothetical protein